MAGFKVLVRQRPNEAWSVALHPTEALPEVSKVDAAKFAAMQRDAGLQAIVVPEAVDPEEVS